jgi:GTPase
MTSKTSIIAIVGRANVGKSSLFNAFLGRREAIVADEPGTTRDSIFGKIEIAGRDSWIVDTAGLKEAKDDFEFTIQEQIVQAADSADLIIVVVEADVPITDEDRRVARMALKSRKPVVLLINKADKNGKVDPADYQRLGIKDMLPTSAIHKQNFGVLEELLARHLPAGADFEPEDDILKLAILGRPNAGKSSLFNNLSQKQQAIVADRAGTTRDVNRNTIRYKETTVELLDTAGIRRSGKIERGVEKFSVLRALRAIEEADICLVLIDPHEVAVALDQKIAGLVKEAGKGLVLVVSKWDLVEKDAFTHDTIAAEIRQAYEFVPWAPLIFVSSETGQNTARLLETVFEIRQTRRQKIATRDLNRWLADVTDAHPPADQHNKHPRLRYMVQEENPIPAFRIFGSHTGVVHWSYRRYLEKQLRLKWDFAGTPIQLWLIENRQKKETEFTNNKSTVMTSETAAIKDK